MVNTSVNAGTRAQNGFALQRNMALFILLDKYHQKFKSKKYFICLEHQEDFLFCFLDEHNKTKQIEAYQSKKKSSGNWTIDGKLSEILIKLLGTGFNLNQDVIPKNSSYSHFLFFSSNCTVLLQDLTAKVTTSVSVNEENRIVAFKDLDPKLKNKIKEKLKKDLTPELEKELENLHFSYIELTTTDSEQQNQLVGKLEEVFKNNITNYRAAVDTLISLFRGIEHTYNQGNQAKLLDETKRVSSDTINETLKIITTKSKAFDYWRAQVKEVSRVLNIKPFERESFEYCFESAFDLFKSYKEVGHQNILNFVKEKISECQTTQEEENVLELFEMFKTDKTSALSDLDLKATIYAAYFEVMYKSNKS